MPKLVVLSEGHAGKSCEITAEKVTIGRVDDNSFAIIEASVSSHHCEVFLRGNDVVIKDLGSTNGSFINGEKIDGAVPLADLRAMIDRALKDAGVEPPPAVAPAAPATK